MDLASVNAALGKPIVEVEGLTAKLFNCKRYGPTIKAAGGRWDAKGGCWTIPLLHATFNALGRSGVPVEHPGVPLRTLPPLAHPNFGRLFPYQQDAVIFLLQNPFPGALLALSPGLGKTPTSIVAAELSGARKVLTICPKVLIGVWREERKRWATVPWNDPKQDPIPEWIVVNWEYFLRHYSDYDLAWDLVILDESVLVKNKETQRYKAIKQLRKKVERMWLLSGSPITRNVSDLWTQLSLCYPAGFTSFWRFVDAYCLTEPNVWSGGRNITGSRNYDFVAEFRDLEFVRNQTHVLPDLPDFVEQSIPVLLEGEQKKLYLRARDDFLVDLQGEEMPITTRLAQLMRLQQIISHPRNLDLAYSGNAAKIEALLELVEAGAIELPLLVWTYFRQTAVEVDAALTARGLRCTHVIGGMDDALGTIEAFKRGEFDALVCSIQTTKFGVTLTNVKTVVYMDKCYDADAFIQSLARVRRLGLDHMFHVINLHAPGTTDDLILENLDGKATSIAAVSQFDLAEILRAL